MSNGKKEPDDFDEEELIRSEFESIVSGISLDESAPTSYLDELDRFDTESFVPPNPPRLTSQGFLATAKNAVRRWFNREDRDNDGTAL